MRGDPFRHSPIAAERCETRLKNAPGRCAPGRPPSSLPRPSASCPPHLLAYGGPPPASGGVSWPNIAFFPRHIHILSRPFRRCQQTQDTPVPDTRTATRVILMHFLHYFSPHPSRHRKTPGLHALARGSVAGNRYHPATYPDGVDRSGISPTCGKDRGNLQGRKAFSATTHELLDALRNRRFTVAAARAVFYIRGRSSDRMTRWVPHPPGRAVSVVFMPRHRFARKQNALHNASFRRGIRRGVGMCRSLSLCCIVSCRLPMTLGRFPRFPHPRGYTHWNGR